MRQLLDGRWLDSTHLFFKEKINFFSVTCCLKPLLHSCVGLLGVSRGSYCSLLYSDILLCKIFLCSLQWIHA